MPACRPCGPASSPRCNRYHGARDFSLWVLMPVITGSPSIPRRSGGRPERLESLLDSVLLGFMAVCPLAREFRRQKSRVRYSSGLVAHWLMREGQIAIRLDQFLYMDQMMVSEDAPQGFFELFTAAMGHHSQFRREALDARPALKAWYQHGEIGVLIGPSPEEPSGADCMRSPRA